MTRAYFFPLFVFLVFLFSLFRIYPHVVPSAPLPPPLYCIVDEHRGRTYFSLCLLGHECLALGSRGWVGIIQLDMLVSVGRCWTMGKGRERG